MKATLGSADPVGPFYAIDVGGKKGARVIILIQLTKSTVIIEKVFTNHKDYVDWTNNAKREHSKQRKQGRNIPKHAAAKLGGYFKVDPSIFLPKIFPEYPFDVRDT